MLFCTGNCSFRQVFGVSDERMGEELAVWIRLAQGSQLNEEEFRTFCKGQVTKHALSHRGELKDYLQGTGN